MSVAREEIFGPVISIMRTKTVDEALAIENAILMAMPLRYSHKTAALPGTSLKGPVQE
jgi:acyl-CoA reductase-like NAD-dependent aldehyde dehydrogenase